MSQMIIEKVKFVVRHMQSMHPGLNFNEPEIYTDFMSNQIVISLRGHVLGTHVETVRYPADWWQAVKERWFPPWLLRRHPVEYTETKCYVTFPNLDVKFLKDFNSESLFVPKCVEYEGK